MVKKFIIGFVCIVLVVVFVLVLLSKGPSIDVANQSKPDTFVIREMTLTRPAFLVIVAANRNHKFGTKIIGYRQHVYPPGTYKDVIIAEDHQQPSIPEGDRSFESDEDGVNYFAVLYEDSDKTSTLSSGDNVVTDVFGRQIIRPFKRNL